MVEIDGKEWVNMGYDLENLKRQSDELNKDIKGRKEIPHKSKEKIWEIFKPVQGTAQICRYEYGNQQCKDRLYILSWIKSSGEKVNKR